MLLSTSLCLPTSLKKNITKKNRLKKLQLKFLTQVFEIIWWSVEGKTIRTGLESDQAFLGSVWNPYIQLTIPNYCLFQIVFFPVKSFAQRNTENHSPDVPFADLTALVG